MFEAFLQKYPNDKRWTPDAMFRLAELYYEKSAEDYLDADEAYKKALDAPNPPDDAAAARWTTRRPSHSTAGCSPSSRTTGSSTPTYYLLGFCLGEMGEEQQAKQALLALVCANKYKPLDPPAQAPSRAGQARRQRRRGLQASCTPVRKDSKFLPEAWTRVGEFHFDSAERAPARHRRLQQGAGLQGLALLRPRHSTSWPGRTTATTAFPRRCASSTTS